MAKTMLYARESVAFDETVTVRDTNGDPVDITGWTFSLALQRQAGATEFTLSMGSTPGDEGLEVVDGAAGALRMVIDQVTLAGIPDTTGDFTLFGDLLGAAPGAIPRFVGDVRLNVTKAGKEFGGSTFSVVLDAVGAVIAAKAQAWAEGGEPGGPGTNSAKGWANISQAQAALAALEVERAEAVVASGGRYYATVAAGETATTTPDTFVSDEYGILSLYDADGNSLGPVRNITASNLAMLADRGIGSSNREIATLTAPGIEGDFYFTTDDVSELVALDPAQAVFIAKGSAPDGSAGAWVRHVPTGIYDIRWFGGDPASDNNKQAMQRAFDLITAIGGGAIFLPRGGPWQFNDVDGRANVNVFGEGPGQTILKRQVVGSKSMIKWVDADCQNIVVDGLTADINTPLGLTGSDLEDGGAGDYCSCFQFDDYRAWEGILTDVPNNIHLRNIAWINSGKAETGNWTIQGLIARGLNGLVVENWYADGVQIKAGGGGYGVRNRNITVRNGVSRDAKAMAVSCVVTTEGMLQNALFENITSYNGQRLHLFMGVDGETHTDVETDGLTIRNCVGITDDIPLPAASSGMHIIMRGGDTGTGLMTCEGNQTIFRGASAVAPSSIYLRPGMGDLICRGNTATGAYSGAAIDIYGANMAEVLNTRIIGNNRGLDVASARFANISGYTYDGQGVGAQALDVDTGVENMRAFVRDVDLINVASPASGSAAMVYRARNAKTLTITTREAKNIPGSPNVTNRLVYERVEASGGTVVSEHIDCDYSGSILAPFLARLAPLNKIKDCKGILTHRRWAETVSTNGSGVATLTHGLAAAPDWSQISCNASHQVHASGQSDSTVTVVVTDLAGVTVNSTSLTFSAEAAIVNS